MTQTEFADLFDLKRTALGSYEEGRAEAKTDTLIKIADYFKISLDQLLSKEITVNEIFHFPDPDKREAIPLIAADEVNAYFISPQQYDTPKITHYLPPEYTHIDAETAVEMPFACRTAHAAVNISDILIIGEYKGQSGLLIGLFENQVCLAECREGRCMLHTASGSIQKPDLSMLSNTKRVLQLILNTA